MSGRKISLEEIERKAKEFNKTPSRTERNFHQSNSDIAKVLNIKGKSTFVCEGGLNRRTR